MKRHYRSVMALLFLLPAAPMVEAQTDEAQTDAAGEYECSAAQALDDQILQLTCTRKDPSDETGDHDYEISGVRRYETSIDDSDWLYFTWRARIAAYRFLVRIEFVQGTFSSICYEDIRDFAIGEQEDELSIPSICGTDAQWDTVKIESADGFTCNGCGTFTRTDLSTQSSISFDAIDPAEAGVISEEIRARANRVRN